MLNIKVCQQFITKMVFIINTVDAHYKKCRLCKKAWKKKERKNSRKKEKNIYFFKLQEKKNKDVDKEKTTHF